MNALKHLDQPLTNKHAHPPTVAFSANHEDLAKPAVGAAEQSDLTSLEESRPAATQAAWLGFVSFALVVACLMVLGCFWWTFDGFLVVFLGFWWVFGCWVVFYLVVLGVFLVSWFVCFFRFVVFGLSHTTFTHPV